MRKTMTMIAIALTISGATGFAAAASAEPNQDHKITICHVPPGNPENAHAITIDRKAWDDANSQNNAHAGDFVVDADHPCAPVEPTTTTTAAPEL
jgi:hypothetical protein